MLYIMVIKNCGAGNSAGPSLNTDVTASHRADKSTDAGGRRQQCNEAEDHRCACPSSPGSDTTEPHTTQPDTTEPGTTESEAGKSIFFVHRISSQAMYLATAVIGVLCAVSVYQLYGDSPPAPSPPQALRLSLESLERHGYSGDPRVQVKKHGYGSPDLLTKKLKKKLAAHWSQKERQETDASEDCRRKDCGDGDGEMSDVKSCSALERQYVVVFDAGSTGTRMHVFLFQCERGAVKLMKEVFVKSTPGLSEFVGQPEEGASSLQTMIDRAVQEVPSSLHSSTPLVFKATAGFRLLNTSGANGLLTKIREKVAATDFQFRPEDIAIMSGTEEGLYSWMTINYLSGQLEGSTLTAGVMDLGGASMQLTYQPPSTGRSSELYPLKLMGATYSLYTHSYLGLGMLAARHSVFTDGGDGTLTSDCLPAMYSGVFTFGGQSYPVRGGASPSRDACWQQVGRLLSSRQTLPPWGMVGPQRTQDLYLISYFYETLQWAGVIADETERIVTVQEFYNASYSVCEAPDVSRPFLCGDLTYITRLLGEGFLLWNTPLHVVSEINSGEASWALGAALRELSGMFI